jgi:hypothetical protein
MIDVEKHQRRPAHIQNAESAPTNQGPSPTVISQEQSAIEERLLAEQQDAAHKDMVYFGPLLMVSTIVMKCPWNHNWLGP